MYENFVPPVDWWCLIAQLNGFVFLVFICQQTNTKDITGQSGRGVVLFVLHQIVMSFSPPSTTTSSSDVIHESYFAHWYTIGAASVFKTALPSQYLVDF